MNPEESFLPPSSPEAEAAVLGCIVISEGACLPSMSGLPADAFFDIRNRDLFQHMVAHQGPCDAVSLASSLRSCGLLEHVGGTIRLGEVQDSVQSPHNLPEYLRILSEKHRARLILRALANTSSQFLRNGRPNDEILAELQSKLEPLTGKPTPADDDLPDPVDLYEWMQIEHPQRPIVIHNLLRTGDKLTLGGGSKSCKTWFAAALGISVSAGKPFIGFRTEKTHVLFVNLELPPDIFHERLRTLQANMNILVPPGMMSIWNLRGKDASIERLDRKLKAMPMMPGLIIIDPLYKILGDRVENAAEDMASLMRILDGIALRNEAAILLPAHFSKGNQSEKSSIDRISGSGVFSRDADAIVTMTQHEEEDAFTLEFTLRGWAPLSPVVVRWEYPLFQRDDALDPEKLKQMKKRGASPKATSEEYLALVPNDGLSQPEIITAFKKTLDVGHSTAYSKFNELKRDGLLEPIPFSNRFRPKSTLDMED